MFLRTTKLGFGGERPEFVDLDTQPMSKRALGTKLIEKFLRLFEN